MPACLNPKRTYKYHLKCDEDNNYLEFRYGTYDEIETMYQVFDQEVNIDDCKTAKEVRTKQNKLHREYINAIKTILVNWHIDDKPYEPDKLGKIISLADIIEIKNELLSKLVNDEIKKKYEPVSPITTDLSVKTADQGKPVQTN